MLKEKMMQLLRPFSTSQFSSLSAAETLHFSYKLNQDPDPEVWSFIKHNIRQHPGNYLSAMIYYSGVLQVEDSELWNLFEMQVTRSSRTSEMSLPSLVRSFAGLSIHSQDFFECFDMLELKITEYLSSDKPASLSILAEHLFVLASLNLTKGSFGIILKRLSNQKSSLLQDEVIRVIWALSSVNTSSQVMKDWLEYLDSLNVDRDSLSPQSKLMLDWSLCYLGQLVQKYRLPGKRTQNTFCLTPVRTPAPPTPVNIDFSIRVTPKIRIKRKLSPILFNEVSVNRLEDLVKYRAKYKRLMADSFIT